MDAKKIYRTNVLVEPMNIIVSFQQGELHIAYGMVPYVIYDLSSMAIIKRGIKAVDFGEWDEGYEVVSSILDKDTSDIPCYYVQDYEVDFLISGKNPQPTIWN